MRHSCVALVWTCSGRSEEVGRANMSPMMESDTLFGIDRVHTESDGDGDDYWAERADLAGGVDGDCRGRFVSEVTLICLPIRV